MIMEGLADIGFQFGKPQGTFYLFPKAPSGDDLAFVNALKDERILAVPGTGFGAPGYFRVVSAFRKRQLKVLFPGLKV